jgi:hypothetical protein
LVLPLDVFFTGNIIISVNLQKKQQRPTPSVSRPAANYQVKLLFVSKFLASKIAAYSIKKAV